jgi:phosphate-selective porin OprO/OprP
MSRIYAPLRAATLCTIWLSLWGLTLADPGYTAGENEQARAKGPNAAAAEEQYLSARQVQQMIDDALQSQAAASPIRPMQYESTGSPAPDASSTFFNQPNWTIDFKDGFFFKSTDGQFSFRFNNLAQVDYRGFSQTAGPVHTVTALHDNFTIAREWLYFRGNATEYVDYQVVLATGTGAGVVASPANVNLLDAYVDFNPFGSEYKDQFQIRLGRFKTPFLYQFYKFSPQDFVTPELSMFGTNFLQNRQKGAMAHGYLADKRIDYAVGIFNGAPNTAEVSFNNRQGIYYLGLAPFLLEEGSFMQNLNLIASGAAGQQFGFAIPPSLSTAAPSAGPPDINVISPTFLTFTPSGGVGGAGATTIHQGESALLDLDVVYAYKSFNFYGEYNTGYQTYAIQTSAGAVVPGTTQEVRVNGWSAAATYFITGEEISTHRRRVKPCHKYGDGGVGAFEVFGRFSNLGLSNNVFSDHLANGAIFANNVSATDIGVNWYLNEYVKVVFDWQHSSFNNPVSLTGAAGGNSVRDLDLFWGRFQLYY